MMIEVRLKRLTTLNLRFATAYRPRNEGVDDNLKRHYEGGTTACAERRRSEVICCGVVSIMIQSSLKRAIEKPNSFPKPQAQSHYYY